MAENNSFNESFTESFQLSKFEIKSFASFCLHKDFNKDLVSCISSPSYTAIILENELSVYKEDTQELLWDYTFNSSCSHVFLSDDLSLLVVVEKPGKLNLFHIPSERLLWSYECENNGSLCTVENVISSCLTSGFLSIYAFTKEGILFEFAKIEFLALYKAIEDDTVSEYFMDIYAKKIELLNMFPEMTIKSTFENFSQVYPVGLETEVKQSDLSMSDYYTIEDMVDGEFTSEWEWNNKETKYFDFDFSGYEKMLKISCSMDGRYIVCLDQKNMLLVFSAFTHQNLAVWGDGDVQDFTFYDTIDPATLSVSHSKIGVLRKNKDGSVFEIMKFPSLELIYKIQLSGSAKLVKSKPNQDSWHITEINESLEFENSTYLNVISISESSPEARLLSLLNRRKFKEAEKYAKICDLNDEIIYKTKMSCMLKDYSKMQLLNLSKLEQEKLWKEVEQMLDKIKDASFIKSCISSLTPDMDIMRKFLSCINNWLMMNNIEGAEEIICEINRNENKLFTYYALPKSIQSNMSVKEFLKKDLLELLIAELKGDCLNAALVIWQSHKNDFLNSISLEQIKEILDAIPDDIPSHHLISFLREDFLPFVLVKFPDAVDIAASWILSHINLLELTEKEFWPENGDSLATMFLDLLQMLQEQLGKKAVSYTTSTSIACIHKKMIDSNFPTGNILAVSKSLKLLMKLKKNFNCKIPLAVFQESRLEFIHAVLDRVTTKHITQAICEFIRPYTLENGIDFDKCLELYIKNVLKNSPFDWWSWDEAPWEEPLSMVLECIIDSDHWSKAALLLISRAKVPWSEKIKKVAEQGLNSENASKSQFKDQSKQVGLKEILVKYDLRHFPMNANLERIYTLVNYILKQDKISAVEDAKQAVLSHGSLTCEAYKKFLLFYLNQNKLDNVVSFLESLPTDIAIDCSQSLLRYISFCLEDNFLIKNAPDQTKTYLIAGLYFTEFLKSKKQHVDIDIYHAFKCLQKLHKEFNTYVTLSDVISKEKALKMVETMINSIIDEETRSAKNGQMNQQSVSKGIFRIKRLGCILGLETDVLAVLITNCLQRGLYSIVVKICRELISSYPTTSSSETIIQVVNHFFQNFMNIKNLSFETVLDTVCHLSNLAVTYCEDGDIEKCMYIVRLSTYMTSIKKITGQQLMPYITPETDIYNKWRFSPVYEDDGFRLDISKVTDFILTLLPFFLRQSSNLEQAVDLPLVEAFNTVFKSIIIHMKDKGQEMAALRTMYQFYHLQIQFLQNPASIQESFSLIANDVKYSIINLLSRVINKRKLDMDLSIGLLSLFPNEQTLILRKLKKLSAKDLRCVMSLGEIGSECCRIFESSEYNEYETMYRRALLLLKQNIRVTQTNIALNSTDSDFNWDVAKEIIVRPKTNLSTIFEFCSAFNFESDHVLIAFLNNLLIESEKLCLASSEIPKDSLTEMLNRTKCAIEAVSREELIVNNLENLLSKISPYSYDVLRFINERLLCCSADVLTIRSGQFEKFFQLLNFLQLYQRVSPPGKSELEQWLSVHPTDGKLPMIANVRLPFSCVFENVSYEIINPELTATTYSIWLTIAPLLNISQDELIMIAIKNTGTNYLKKLRTTSLTLNQDNFFLENIHRMLSQITDPELATAGASWVTNKMPPGTNKVCCCMMAEKFAEKWHRSHPNDRKALDIFKKSTRLRERCNLEVILHQYNLANEITLSYTQNSLQLVEYLIEEFCFSAESSIKVCEVAKEISKVVNMNIDEIFKKSLLNWLCTVQNSVGLDETFSLNDSMDNFDTESVNEDKNILKAINLLLGIQSINRNISESLKQSYLSMTVIQKSRLTFCMVAVYGYTFVAHALDIPSDAMKELLPPFLCAAELEQLHISYSRGESVFSLELVQNILSHPCVNPKILLCCVRICLEGKIWLSQIWEVILQRLMMMSMTDSLQDILLTSQGNLTHMWHNKTFTSAWNCIISNCYKNDFSDPSKVVERVYKTILSCPCVSALDVESLWNDLKYFVKNMSSLDLEEMEQPVSDSCAFIQALKTLRESTSMNSSFSQVQLG